MMISSCAQAVDVVEPQRPDLAPAQAVAGDQQQHGVVASPVRLTNVDHAEQAAHLLPRQGARHVRAIRRWRWPCYCVAYSFSYVLLFRTLDFFQASAILRAAKPIKTAVKWSLETLLAE